MKRNHDRRQQLPIQQRLAINHRRFRVLTHRLIDQHLSDMSEVLFDQSCS